MLTDTGPDYLTMCSLTLAASTSQLPVCRAVVICDRWLGWHQCSKRWGHKVHSHQSQQGVEMCFYPATDPEGLLLLCWTQVGWQNTLRPESLALWLGLSRHVGHVHVKPKHTFPETIKKDPFKLCMEHYIMKGVAELIKLTCVFC